MSGHVVTGRRLFPERVSLLRTIEAEADRVAELRTDVARRPGECLRLVELVCTGTQSEHVDELLAAVRAVRRLRPTGSTPDAAARLVRLDAGDVGGWGSLDPVIVWSVRRASGLSWFADPALDERSPGSRLAAIYAAPGDLLPVLAFDPFPAGELRPERIFTWAAVPHVEPREGGR